MIDVLSRFEQASDRWAELAAQTRNIFSTVEWARAWWKHFGSGKSLVLAQVRDGAGQVVAILPLHSERHGGVRILRFLGHGVADQLGPVCHPSQVGVATAALRELSGSSGLLLAERLRAETDWSDLGGRLLYEEASPSITVARGGGWDAYLASRSAHSAARSGGARATLPASSTCATGWSMIRRSCRRPSTPCSHSTTRAGSGGRPRSLGPGGRFTMSSPRPRSSVAGCGCG